MFKIIFIIICYLLKSESLIFYFFCELYFPRCRRTWGKSIGKQNFPNINAVVPRLEPINNFSKMEAFMLSAQPHPTSKTFSAMYKVHIPALSPTTNSQSCFLPSCTYQMVPIASFILLASFNLFSFSTFSLTNWWLKISIIV